MPLAISFRRMVSTMAIVAASLVLLSSHGAPRAQPPANDPLADLPAVKGLITDARPGDDRPERPPRLAARAAEVLGPDSVRQYSRRMRLSDPQKLHLASLYTVYREGIDRLYQEHGPFISKRAEALAVDSNYDFEYVRDFAELRQREQIYERELIALEDRLFADLWTVLAEEQWPLLDAVKLQRARTRCNQFDIEIYEARIDLTSIIEKADLDTDTLRDLESTMLEYEQAITPLWLEIDRQGDKTNVESARLMAMQMFRDDGSRIEHPASDADRVRMENARIERERLNKATISKQDQLADINMRFLERVLDLIPKPKRAFVHAEYLRFAHPRVYPDRHDPAALRDAAIASLPEDSDVRPVVQAAWDTYRQNYDALTKDMIVGVRKWNRHMTLTNTQDIEPVKAVREARFKRWEASEKFIDQMVAMLPLESAAAIEMQVRNYRLRLDSEREREKEPRMANP